MSFDAPFVLIFNSFALALAMAFLFIVLWYDVRRIVNQFFALFLILVQVWNIGFLLAEIMTLLENAPIALSNISATLTMIGFVGSSISLYALMTLLVGMQPKRFRLWTLAYLVAALGYIIFLSRTSENFATSLQGQSFKTFFFVVFDTLTLYVTWRYRRKFTSFFLMIGVLLFISGQSLSFLNVELGIVTLSTTISSVGALIISFIIIQRELINPLVERGSQLESMHDVSLAITSRIATDAVLGEIAERAAGWLEADASGIFLKREDGLELVAIYQLQQDVLHHKIALGQSVVGKVAETKKTIYLENYKRDWDGSADLPLAFETFGSVICVPLIYDADVIGVLMVIAGAHGHLFDEEDAHLLELLASQAAVAIAYGDLFNEQRDLTEQLAIAHEQLRTVLSSTESPVVAVDRYLNLIFTNPAAEDLFGIDTIHQRDSVMNALPSRALPPNLRVAFRHIKQNRAYRYEIDLDGKTYLCHVASLGTGRIEGFVAVLNDVTELKELDRIKSEMVRMTSHDLKNPLQAAMANLDLLRDDVEDLHDSEVELSLNNIEKQLNKMYRIIGGILDLERVRYTKPIELCHVQEILQDAVDELQDMADDNHIRLQVAIAADVADFIGDTNQFKRALVNIIENAIKFSHANGVVDIQARNDNGSVFFTIQDEGIGIPEALHEKIFDRFYRGHQPGAEHISGSGLGLSLVKAVVESHNGKLWVESVDQRGTTFFIRIPAVEMSSLKS